MRYRVEANLIGDGEQVMHFDDFEDADITFQYLLDAGARPVRLFDGDELLKRAENGIRRSC